MRRIISLSLFSLFFLPNAHAGLFKITCSGCNSVTQSLATKLENDVNKDLPDADATTYLEGMANAGVMSGKHIGQDYANDVDAFIIGLGLGAGADLGDQGLGDLMSGDIDGNQVRGIGIQPSVLFGLNLGLFDMGELGPIEFDRLKTFVNFGTIDKDLSGVKAKATNFGLHFRYKWKDPQAIIPGRMLYWTGVDLHTGFEYQSFEATYTETRSKAFTESGVTATIDGTVTLGTEVKTISIPVEISSGFQLAYALSFYGGMGADINSGSAKANATVNAPITLSGSSASLTGTLDVGQEASPDAFSLRTFAGLQFNLPLVKLVNVQLDRGLNNDAWGIGIRALAITW